MQPTETREQKIARLESIGHLDPSCLGCRERYEAADPVSVFAPNHKPSSLCQSGQRPHCSCARCF